MYNIIRSVGKKAKTFAKSSLFKKTLMLAIVALCAITPAFAESGASGVVGSLNNLANDFKNYIDPVRKIVYAIAAICAVVGSFTIYFKMTNGDQDVKKTIMLTVGGVAGLVALATALPAVFN